jgi:hypothetical protein
VASRSCWAIQASVGERVTLTCTISRLPCRMMTKAKSGRNQASWSWRKSQAQMSAAWFRRNVRQVWPRPARGRQARRYFWIVRLLTRRPELQELAADPLSPPERVGVGHGSNQLDDLRAQPSGPLRPSGAASPEEGEQIAMPAQEGNVGGTRL